MIDIYLLIATSILCLLRIAGVTHIAYQAVVHLFVGGLFGYWLADRNRYFLLFLFGVLVVVETVMFFHKFFLV